MPCRRLRALLLVLLTATVGSAAARTWYEMAEDFDLIKGVKSVEIITPSIIEFTIDYSLSPDAEADAPNDLALYQKPELFSVTSATDANFAAGVQPTDVGVFSWKYYNKIANKVSLKTAAYLNAKLWYYVFYLYLDTPLESGHTYTVAVDGADTNYPSSMDLVYDVSATTSKIFKVNQGGYSTVATQRYAYLGWWAGDRGPVDYSAFSAFDVVDVVTGNVVLANQPIVARAMNDTMFSGEDVYELDIASLGAGQYQIEVPGLCRSDSFTVGLAGLRNTYYHSMRAFFHRRCGQEFREPWTSFAKPACHTECWESGHLVNNGGLPFYFGDGEAYVPFAGEKKRTFRGGYHDAADYDAFHYHIPAVAKFLLAYDMFPSAFADNDLNIPESGNGIPDILDEGVWGLLFFMENQYPDGSVPMGRGALALT